MADKVTSYDGYEAAVRPRAFLWEGQWITVAEVLTQARTVDGKRFRIRTLDDQVFELLYVVHTGEWQVQQP